MNRTAYGLGTDPVDNWRREALCAQADPDLWVIPTGTGGRPVKKAIEICGRCPVRIPCRDEHLALPTVGVVAGGWAFYSGTGSPPRPYPGDEGLARGRRGPARRVDVVRAARYVAAGRAVVAGASVDEVGELYGLSRTTVWQAASIVQHLPADTVQAVERGEITITEATRELRRSGAARQTKAGAA